MRISNLLSAACAAAFLTGSLAVRAQDTPAQAAARAALMQKMTEMDAQQSQPTNSNPLASVVIPPSAGQEQAVQPAVVTPTIPPPVVPPPATPEVAPVVNPPPPANESYAGKTLGLKPIDAPPPPVSARKEAELQALLAKYMADQVTPDEYQKARAAILAEP